MIRIKHGRLGRASAARVGRRLVRRSRGSVAAPVYLLLLLLLLVLLLLLLLLLKST